MTSRRVFTGMAVASASLLATKASALASVTMPFDPAKSQAFVQALGIRYPICCAAAGGPFSDALAVAICEAGGLGGIGSVFLPPDVLKARITRIKAGTRQPFAVGYILVFGDKTLSAALEAGAPVIQFSWGTPTAQQVALVRSFGAKMGMQISTVAGAKQALGVGADYLVCQGQEAGGHVQAQSNWRDNLQPILKVVGNTPVVISGGLGDGKALREVLAMGASGGVFGTRFIATQEATATAEWKRRLTASAPSDTALTVCFDGAWPQALHRVLRNDTLDNWEASGSRSAGQRPGEGEIVAHFGTRDLPRYFAASPMVGMTGTPEEMSMFAGLGVGAINDTPPAGELVRRIWAECTGIAA